MNTKHICFSILLAACLSACANVEQGTGQVLDNAGSAIRSESSKLWVPNDKAKTEEKKQQDEESSRRY